MTIRLTNVRLSYPHLKPPARFFVDKMFADFMRQCLFSDLIRVPDPIPYIVGYDPQKLLPAPGDPYKAFADQILAAMAKNLGIDPAVIDLGDHRWFPMPDFPSGGEIDLSRRRARTFDDVAVYRVVGEKFVRVDPENIDLREAELRMLTLDMQQSIETARLSALLGKPLGEVYAGPRAMGKTDARGLYDDFMFDHLHDKPNVVETAGGRRDKSYLKHDRTKKHNRRR